MDGDERPLKLGFDIGGVVSKHPAIFRKMMRALEAGGAECHFITDMHDKPAILTMLARNGFDFIPPERVHPADFETYGEACKAVILQQLGIDVHFDDFPAYVSGGCPVRFLIMPSLTRPYYDDGWQTDGREGEFGRRKRVDAAMRELVGFSLKKGTS